jgi:hypothetical protein
MIRKFFSLIKKKTSKYLIDLQFENFLYDNLPQSPEDNEFELKRSDLSGTLNPSEWMETPQTKEPFALRGKTYLEDKIKYKCTESKFHVVAVDLSKLQKPNPHTAARSDSHVRYISLFGLLYIYLLWVGP